MAEEIKNENRVESANIKEEPYRWLNRKIHCSPHICDLEWYGYTIERYKDTKILNVPVKMMVWEGEEQVEKTVWEDREFYKHPAECLTQIANSNLIIAETQIFSANLIAQSIMKSSQILATSIENLTNEIERKNKMDEYYMLLKEIEQYEDTLMKLKCFTKAYEKMDLVEIPIINIDRCEAEILYDYNRSCDFDRLIKLSKHYLEHPLVFLPELITEEENKRREREHIMKEVDYFKKPRKLKSDSGVTREECMKERIRACAASTVPQYLSPEDVAEQIKKRYDKKVENQERDISKKYHIEDFYIKLSESIENINREILLINLRKLHSELRRAVREYKIKSYNEA